MVVGQVWRYLSKRTEVRTDLINMSHLSSQMTACMSNMLVGSSSNSKSGLLKRALAKAILILHPPENVLVAAVCPSAVNPSPDKMTAALAGALAESIASSSWKTSVSLELISGSVSPASILAFRSLSSFRSPSLTTWLSSTDWIAGVSSPTTWQD